MGLSKLSLMISFVILPYGLFAPRVGRADNPLISQVYTADPNGFVYNDRLYFFCSHHLDNQSRYDIYDYILILSNDLVNWTDHGVVFDTNDISWAARASSQGGCSSAAVNASNSSLNWISAILFFISEPNRGGIPR